MITSWRSLFFYTALAGAAVGSSYYLGRWQTQGLDDAYAKVEQVDKNSTLSATKGNSPGQGGQPRLSVDEIKRKLAALGTPPFSWDAIDDCEDLLKGLDPAEAVKLAMDMPPGDVRNNVMMDMMRYYAKSDPQAAMDFLVSLPHDDAMLLFRAVVSYGMNSETAKVAAQYLDKLANTNVRDGEMKNLTLALARSDPAQALAWLNQVATLDVYTKTLAEIFSNLSSSGDEARTDDGFSVLGSPGHSNLNAAIALLGNLTDPAQRATAITAMAGGWGKSDPQAAVAWAANLPDADSTARTAALNNIVGSWAKDDPVAVLAFVQNSGNPALFLPDAPALAQDLAQGDAPTALAFAQSLPAGATRDQAMNNVLTTLAATDFPSAWSDAQNLPESASRDSALTSLVGVQANMNPAQAADLLSQFSAGPALETATQTLATTWVKLDPQAASIWMNTLPVGPPRDGAVVALIAAKSPWEPTAQAAVDPGLLQWANTIAAPATRVDQIQQIITNWANGDPGGALKALQSTNLPADKRAALLKTIKQMQAAGR